MWWALYRNPSESTTVNRAELDYIEAGGGGEYKGQPLDFKWRHIGALLRHRQVIGASIGQFGGNSTLVFFLTWFPDLPGHRARHDVHQGRHDGRRCPTSRRPIGVVLGGLVSDTILKRTGSANLARKLPIVSGMLLASTIILANYVPADDNALVIAIMSLAFFGQGMTNLGWTVVSDIAPEETDRPDRRAVQLQRPTSPASSRRSSSARPSRRPARSSGRSSTSPSSRCSAPFAYSVILGDIHRLDIETE